jgi:hypothetical protein
MRETRKFRQGQLVHYERDYNARSGRSVAFCGAADGGTLRHGITLEAAITEDQADCVPCLQGHAELDAGCDE